MTRRWNWDFEDERRAGPGPAPAASVAPAVPPSVATPSLEQRRRTQIRRRRGAALGVALLALLAILITALSGSHSASPATSSKLATRVARKRPAGDSEKHRAAAVSSVLGYTPFAREGGGRGRDIALTFDDGPGPYTPQVLSVLERLHAQATFFIVGKMLRYFSASTVREIEDGDAIGDHTESHPQLARLSRHDQHEEIFEGLARVELLGGRRPDLFRPPYGSFNASTLRELHSLHLLMVLWSTDTGDYAQPGVSTIVERALAGAHPGAIILMHDAGGTRTETIAALPLIITKLRARGFHLVTVPQLLLDDPPPAGQQLPTDLSGG